MVEKRVWLSPRSSGDEEESAWLTWSPKKGKQVRGGKFGDKIGLGDIIDNRCLGV